MSQMGVGVAGGQEKMERSGRRGGSRPLQEMKNSGNEAKESLKTKEEGSKTNPKTNLK